MNGRVAAGSLTCLVALVYAFLVARESDDVRDLPSYPSLNVNNEHAVSRHHVDFTLCSGVVLSNCVVDGDTFRLGRMRIRIADIDAPEVFKAPCVSERRAGEAAKKRLLALLNAGAFWLVADARDEDRYGRKLRIVARDKSSIGEILVREGLTRRWNSPPINWCG